MHRRGSCAITVRRVARIDALFDRALVLAGAALHDAGKIVQPAEMHAPGHLHEEAGAQLLAGRVPPRIARFCVTHASWHGEPIEDLLVALADKLWKGKRDEALEAESVDAISRATSRERWAVFAELDAIFDDIAAAGPERLARSNV